MQYETVNNSVIVEPLGNHYQLRFDDIVVQPSYYRYELQALQLAQGSDKVSAVVNSDGGSLASGIEIANAIFNCQAEVEGILRSSCHSCGSIIFLACSKHDVGLASSMLLHSGSGYNGGTPNQSVQRAESYKKQVRTLFETVYKGFLDQDEIDAMIEDDKEYIFESEEIVERLHRMYEYRQSKVDSYQQELEDAFYEENDKIIDDALNSLDIPQEEKDLYIKVRDAIDSKLEVSPSEDLLGILENSEEVSPDEESKEEMHCVVVEDVGTLQWCYDEEGFLVKVEFLVGFEEGDIIRIPVNEDLLDKNLASWRKHLLYVVGRTTGSLTCSSWATKRLAKRFVSEMNKIIDKHTT